LADKDSIGHTTASLDLKYRRNVGGSSALYGNGQ